MRDIVGITKLYLEGKIDDEQYKQKIQRVCEIVDENRSGINSLSFISSATEEIDGIGSFEEDNDLRKMALLCDIFNNMAHSLKESKMRNRTGEELLKAMFGMKKMMTFGIIKECKKTNNKSFGLISSDDQKDNMFVVDIPGCGQMKWHFPKSIVIHSQRYPFQIVDNKTGTTNKELILQEKTMSQIRKLSEHNQRVINSMDVQEMNDNLELVPHIIAELQSSVKAEEERLQSAESLSISRKNIEESQHEFEQ